MIIATGLDSSGLILYQSISYADVTPNTQSIVDIDLLSISSLTIPPEVVSVTANFPDGFFKAESIIDIIIEFSQVVDVTGIPQLDLADSIGKIDFVSGSGTKELIFQYTVGAGQNCTDLDYVGSGSLTLNGGTIQNGGEVNALLTLSEPGTAGSLGDAVNIVIDTIAPFLNVDDIIVNNTVLPNTITVIFSEKIDSAAAEVVGNWLLESNGGDNNYLLNNAVLGADGKTVTLTLVIPDSTNFNTFIYSDAVLEHMQLTPPTDITDLAQNLYIGGQMIEAGATHILDTTAPTVVTVHTLDDDENGVIDTIEIEFSEAVCDNRFSGNQGDWSLEESGQGEWDNFLNFSTDTSSVAISSTADDRYVSLNIAVHANIVSTGPMDFQYTGTAIIDFAGNTLATISTTPTVDKARPILLGILATVFNIGTLRTSDSIKFIYSETMSDPVDFSDLEDVSATDDVPVSFLYVSGFGAIVTDSSQNDGPPAATTTESSYSLFANDTIHVVFGTLGVISFELDGLSDGATFTGTALFEDLSGNKCLNKDLLPVNFTVIQMN